MGKLTEYERKQLDAIQRWKAEEPGVVNKAFGIAVEPLAWLVDQVVPEAAVRGALDLTSTAAKWLTDTGDIVRDADVRSIEELRTKDLGLSDNLANGVHDWAIGIAVAEGGAIGILGILGAPVDIPAVLTIALRTIHKIGVCYGYECKTDLDHKLILGVLSASGANTMREKTAALSALRSIQVVLAKVAWKKMAEKAAQNQLSKEAAILAVKKLAKQLGMNLTKRKALGAIPFIGAAIGGSVNGWYIKEVGWAARRAFQERWLIENKKIVDVSPDSA